MIKKPACPVCGECHWHSIGSRIYRLEDYSGLSPYVKKRYRVLFEVWYPGVHEVLITSQCCEHCGFVLYIPRPSEENLDAKYKFLSTLEPDNNISEDDQVINNRRGRLIYNKVKEYLPKGPKGRKGRVLDFGGGEGRLLRDFIAQGSECSVVDYCEQVFPGVNRIGSTIADIPSNAKFDLIICSHVIEHVANPLNIIATLMQHLDQEGAIFIEVPMEIWGKAPLHDEPVTHINFFTPSSLRLLMERAGISVSSCRLGGMPHNSGRMELVVRAIGNLGQNLQSRSRVTANRAGLRETQNFLDLSVRMKLFRYLLMPSIIPGAIAYKFRQLKRSL
jgi:hypothetical protein